MADDAIKISWHQNCLAEASVLHHLKLLHHSLVNCALKLTYYKIFTYFLDAGPLRIYRCASLNDGVTFWEIRRCANVIVCIYRGADKSLARPGRKKATATEDFGFRISYTGCHRRNEPNFGRVFLMLNYTDITQNTYVQSWTVIEIMAK